MKSKPRNKCIKNNNWFKKLKTKIKKREEKQTTKKLPRTAKAQYKDRGL